MILTDTKEMIDKVEAALDTMRPYLINDGGNVEVVGINDDMEVEVRLLGACGNCPASFMTMKAGIEQAIKNAVPGITAVKAIDI